MFLTLESLTQPRHFNVLIVWTLAWSVCNLFLQCHVANTSWPISKVASSSCLFVFFFFPFCRWIFYGVLQQCACLSCRSYRHKCRLVTLMCSRFCPKLLFRVVTASRVHCPHLFSFASLVGLLSDLFTQFCLFVW